MDSFVNKSLLTHPRSLNSFVMFGHLARGQIISRWNAGAARPLPKKIMMMMAIIFLFFPYELFWIDEIFKEFTRS